MTRHSFIWRVCGKRGWVGGGGGATPSCFGVEGGRSVFSLWASRHANHFLRGTLRFFFFHASFVFVMAGGEEDFNLFNQLVFLRGTLFGGHSSKEERLLGS